MTFSSVRTALQSNGKKCFNSNGLRPTITHRVMGSLRRSLSTTAGAAATTTNSPSSSSSSTDGNKQNQQQRLIPTRHSSKAPPPVCRDAIELQELTQELLGAPIGSLFCQSSKGIAKSSTSSRNDRDEAYATARESGELVEYLLRGYNATISPLTLCGTMTDKSSAGTAASMDLEQVSVSLETMMDVTERFHQEGQMYLQLRKEGLDYKNAANPTDSSSSSSSSSSDSDSDDDDLLDDLDKDGTNDPRFSSAVVDKLKVDARDKKKQQKQLGSGANDFALPGVTTAMYDTILDAMACAAQVSLEAAAAGSQQSTTTTGSSSSYLQLLEPDDLYRVTGAAWNAHELNNQHNNDNDLFFPSTTPTMVTYNATLRGIGNLCLAASSSSDDDDNRRRMVVDQGLAYGFGVYNNLTHNDHGLPKRNSASVVYLLNVIRACIPPSRTRGNMTVALWHQASMEGLVTAELIRTLKDLHVESNGPEFDVFLESLDQCTAQKNDDSSRKVVITPQRFARFAKKYSHSKHY